MKMTIRDAILKKHSVGKALGMLRCRMEELGLNEEFDTLSALEEDYKLMCGCFARGLYDPEGESVYGDLLRRTYRLYNNVRLASIVKKRQSYIRSKNISEWFAKQEKGVKDSLESFVQETALASLLPQKEHLNTVRRINAVHQRYMDGLFNYIVVSMQWSGETKTSYCSLLTSPTVDQNDALLIVSAITLALLTVFDINKWLTLSYVYRSGCYVALRQRALVGMMMSLPNEEATLFPEINAVINDLCTSDEVRGELLELQMQLFHCMGTAADNAEIQRDIMPTLIENNNLRITRTGIVEKDDSVDDILDAGKVDRNVEEVEKKMKKMLDMQKTGSDIYFGGFSQMKRFYFFQQLSNWFAPFSLDNPDVVNAAGDVGLDLLRKALGHNPFCDSDCYSFALALAKIAGRLPDNIKEMMSNGYGGMTDEVANRRSPAYIRRMYLQDLYRFFMLYQNCGDFINPFSLQDEAIDGMNILFLGKRQFDGLMEKESVEMAMFLFKHHYYGAVIGYLENRNRTFTLTEDERVVLGLSYMRLGKYVEAHNVFEKLSKEEPTKKTLKGLADSLFLLRRFAEAAEVYGKVVAKYGDTKTCVIYKSIAQINSGQIKEGMAELFHLDYEDGNDVNVKRAIAWGYLMSAKPMEAERVYAALESETNENSDILNFGYARWINGNVQGAIILFTKYISVVSNDASGCKHCIKDDFDADADMLQINGVKPYQKQMMIDMLEHNV